MRFFILVDLLRGTIHGVVEAASLEALQRWNPPDRFAVTGNPDGYHTEVEAKQQLRNLANDPASVLETIQRQKRVRDEQAQVQKNLADYIAQDPISNKDNNADRIAESDVDSSKRKVEPRAAAEQVKQQLKAAGSLSDKVKQATDINAEKLGSLEGAKPYTEEPAARSQPPRIGTLSDLSSVVRNRAQADRTSSLRVQSTRLSVTQLGAASELTHKTAGSIVKPNKGLRGVSADRFGSNTAPTSTSKLLNRVTSQKPTSALGYGGQPKEANLTDVSSQVKALVERSAEIIRGELSTEATSVLTRVSGVKRAEGVAESYFDTKTKTLVIGDNLNKNLKVLGALSTQKSTPAAARADAALQAALELRHELIHTAVGKKLSTAFKGNIPTIHKELDLRLEEGLTERLNRLGVRKFVEALTGKSVPSLNKTFDLLEASGLSGKTDPLLAEITNKGASSNLETVSEFMTKLGIVKPEDIINITKLTKLEHAPSERAERLMWWGKEIQSRDNTKTTTTPTTKAKKTKPKADSTTNAENLENINNSKSSAPKVSGDGVGKPKKTSEKPAVSTKARREQISPPPAFELLEERSASNKRILRIAAIGADARGTHGAMAAPFDQERERIRAHLLETLDRNPSVQLRVATNLQPGFGLLAAEAALDLRRQGRDVTLDVVLANQDAHLEAYPLEGSSGRVPARRAARERAEAVLNQANRVIIATDKSNPIAVAERLDTAARYMVQHSDEVLTGGRLSLGGRGAVFERALGFALEIGKKVHRLSGSFEFGGVSDTEVEAKFKALNIQRATVLAGYSLPSVSDYAEFVRKHPDKADSVGQFIEFQAEREVQRRAQRSSVEEATGKVNTDRTARLNKLSQYGVSETTGAQELAHASRLRQLINDGDNIPSAAHKGTAAEIKPLSVTERTDIPAPPQNITPSTNVNSSTPASSSGGATTGSRAPSTGQRSFNFDFARVPEEQVDYRTVQFGTEKSALGFLKDVGKTKLPYEGADVDAYLVRSSDKNEYTKYRYSEDGNLVRTTYNPQTKATSSSVITEKAFIQEFRRTQTQDNVIREKLNVKFFGARKPAEGPTVGSPQPLMQAVDQATGTAYSVMNNNDIRYLYGDIKKSANTRGPQEVVSQPTNTEPVVKQTPKVAEHYGAMSLSPKLSSSTGPGAIAPLPTFSPSATGTPLAPLATRPTWTIPGAAEQSISQNEMEVRTRVGNKLPEPADYQSAVTKTLRTQGPQGIRSLLANLNARSDIDTTLRQTELRGHLDNMVESGIVTRNSRGKYALSDTAAADLVARTSPSAGRAATVAVGAPSNPLLVAQGNLEAQAAYFTAIEETRASIKAASAQTLTANTVPVGVVSASSTTKNSPSASLAILQAVEDVSGPRKPTLSLSASGVGVSRSAIPLPSAAAISRATDMMLFTPGTPKPYPVDDGLGLHIDNALNNNPKGFRLKDITNSVNESIAEQNAIRARNSLESLPAIVSNRSTVTPTTTRIDQRVPAPVTPTSIAPETRPMSWVLPADKEPQATSKQIRESLQQRVAAGDLAQKPSGEYTYADKVNVPSGASVLTSSQTRVAQAPTAMQQALATVRNAFKATSIENFMTGLDGMLAPTSREMRGLAGGALEVVGGLVLSERVLKPIFGKASEHSNTDLIKDSAALAAGTVLFSSRAGMAAALRMNSGQSLEEAKHGFATMVAGMTGSALAKAGASIALPKMPVTRSAAGLIGSTLAWAAAPIVASVFVQFKEASQKHMGTSRYDDSADVQSAMMANDIVLQLSESAEMSFTANVITDEGEDIEFEGSEEFDEITQVENEFGEPLPFDVNLSVNPFLPGKQ
jgi:hypothetical protein